MRRARPSCVSSGWQASDSVFSPNFGRVWPHRLSRSTEALESWPAIEGEMLDRASLQSSIRRHFGLSGDRRAASPAEAGVAEMMMALYREFDRPLDHDMLLRWHRMLMGERRVAAAGAYRQHREAMQIVSGPDYAPRVHYEAPPSRRIEAEMDRFLVWYAGTRYAGTQATQEELPALTRAGPAHLSFVCMHPFDADCFRPGLRAEGALRSAAVADRGGDGPLLVWYAGTQATQEELSALTRAGTAHLYFVCIHPFEVGNGRIGRALAEKALAQLFGEPSLIALSRTIARRRKAYYAALEGVGPSLDITDWLVWVRGHGAGRAAMERAPACSVDPAGAVLRAAPRGAEPAPGEGASGSVPVRAGRFRGRSQRQKLSGDHARARARVHGDARPR